MGVQLWSRGAYASSIPGWKIERIEKEIWRQENGKSGRVRELCPVTSDPGEYDEICVARSGEGASRCA